MPDFVELGEAGIAVEHTMRHRRSLQLHLRRDAWWRERRARSEDWQVFTSFQSTKALACLHHAGSRSAQRHDGIAPALHIAPDTMHRPHHVFDSVGAGERTA